MSEINKKNPRIFHGWWTVIVTGFAGGLSYGFYILGFSVFFKDLAAELNLGRAATSVAAGIGLDLAVSKATGRWKSGED